MCFWFFWLCHTACKILVPWPEIEPEPLQRKHQVLTTAPPRNSLALIVFIWSLYDSLCRVPCHLQIVIVLPFPFQFGYLLFFFLVWLLWLGLPLLCWIVVVRVGIFVLFLNLARRLSAFHCWVLCWLWVCCKCLLLYSTMFPLPLRCKFLSQIVVEFYQMLFLYLLRWSCGSFLMFLCYITLINLHVLNCPCDPGMNPTWSWCMILFIYYWIWFANILFNIFTSVFIKVLACNFLFL